MKTPKFIEVTGNGTGARFMINTSLITSVQPYKEGASIFTIPEACEENWYCVQESYDEIKKLLCVESYEDLIDGAL